MSSTAIAPAASTALAEQRGFVQLQTLAQAREFAEIICLSGVAPKDYTGKDKVNAAIVAMQFGYEIGLPPLQALQSIAVVNGRPSLWGDGLRALILSAPDLEDISETDANEIASCSIKRKGRAAVVRSFSVADAKAAGLYGKQGPWTQYPTRMRQLRAFGFAARDAYADRLKGIQLAEEALDIEPTEKDVTPPKEPQRVTVAVPEAVAAPAAPPSNGGNGNGATDKLLGVTFLDTAYIAASGSKAARWEVKTAEHGTLYVLDEQLAKSIETCVDTGVCFSVDVKLTKASTGIAKIVTQIDPEDGGDR